MSVNRNPLVGELCFAAEGLSGTAAAASLRRLGSIMEQAPSGRLFAAISTLSDMSAKAAAALEKASHAMNEAHDGQAASELSAAVAQMDAMAANAQPPARLPRSRAARRG
jgi:hypothetical protein